MVRPVTIFLNQFHGVQQIFQVDLPLLIHAESRMAEIMDDKSTWQIIQQAGRIIWHEF